MSLLFCLTCGFCGSDLGAHEFQASILQTELPLQLTEPSLLLLKLFLFEAKKMYFFISNKKWSSVCIVWSTVHSKHVITWFNFSIIFIWELKSPKQIQNTCQIQRKHLKEEGKRIWTYDSIFFPFICFVLFFLPHFISSLGIFIECILIILLPDLSSSLPIQYCVHFKYWTQNILLI